MHWSTWTHYRAVGTGTDVKANGYCHPIRKLPVTITFSQPKRFCGHYIFSKVAFVYPTRPKLNSVSNPIYDRTC